MQEKPTRARTAGSSEAPPGGGSSGASSAKGAATEARALTAAEVRLLVRRSMGDDAMALHRMVSRLLGDSALILDHEQLVRNAEGRIGVLAGLEGLEFLELERIQECVEWAIDELQRRECELDESGAEVRDGELETYEFLIRGMGVRRQDARSTTLAYNALPQRTRRAFRRVVLEHESGAQLIGDGWDSLDQVRDDALEALGVIMGRELRAL